MAGTGSTRQTGEGLQPLVYTTGAKNGRDGSEESILLLRMLNWVLVRKPD